MSPVIGFYTGIVPGYGLACFTRACAERNREIDEAAERHRALVEALEAEQEMHLWSEPPSRYPSSLRRN